MIKLLPLIALLGATSSMAATITFQAGVNGYDHLGIDIRQNGVTANGAQTLTGYQNGETNNHEMRSVLSFGLSMIPAGSIINSISLTLVSDGGQAGNIAGMGTINLHEIIPNGSAANNFSEAGTNWTNWGNAGTGTPWITLGGDFGSVLTTAALDNPNTNTVLDAGETATFTTSAAFVAAAQAAFDAGLPLELILIAPTAEANTTAANFIRFRTDDHTDTATRPLLTINYTIPEPTSALLALVAGVPFITRRRR